MSCLVVCESLPDAGSAAAESQPEEAETPVDAAPASSTSADSDDGKSGTSSGENDFCNEKALAGEGTASVKDAVLLAEKNALREKEEAAAALKRQEEEAAADPGRRARRLRADGRRLLFPPIF